MKHRTNLQRFIVEGMTCEGCFRKVASSLKKDGFSFFSIDTGSGEGWAILPPDKSTDDLLNSIKRAGYKAYLIEEESRSGFFIFLIILGICAIYFIVEMFARIEWLSNPMLQFIVATVALITGIRIYGQGMIRGIISLKPNMDVLIMIGALSAYIYSIVLMTKGDRHLYFESTAVILAVVSLGHWLEKKVKNITLGNIVDYFKEGEKVVKVIEGNRVIEKPALEVKKGEEYILAGGDINLIDGKIINGKVECDLSLISGESGTVLLDTGNTVRAGAKVVAGNAILLAENTFLDSTYSVIVSSIINAQIKKTPGQNMADRISYYFTYIILAIAFVTAILWYVFVSDIEEAIINGIAVVVVACPCALGIAAPIVYSLTAKRAMKFSFVIKDPIAIEVFPLVSTIVFDKTGTLTACEHRVTNIELLNSASINEVISILYNVELHSNHPVARSIVKYLTLKYPGLRKEYEKVRIKEEAGKGINALIEDTGTSIFMGKISDGSDTNESIYKLSVNGKDTARIHIENSELPGIDSLFDYFRKNKVKIWILSGDSEEKVKKFAEKYGADGYISGATPQDKYSFIQNMIKKGGEEKICMVGDGVNDAMAMSIAHVSISFSGGTDIARDTASVVIQNYSPEKIIELHKFLTYSRSVLEWNFIWALVYNIALIPIAAYGIITPSLAAVAMTISDLCLLANSSRILFYKQAEG